MPDVTITSLPAAASAASGAVVAADNAGGTLTEKVTLGQIAALAAGSAPVQSVNGSTGTVVLSAASVTAAAAIHTHSTSDVTGFSAAASAAAPVQSVNGKTGTISLAAADVTAASSTHVSQHQVTGSDPLVPVTATFTMSVNTDNWAPGALDVAYITNTSTANINLSGMSTASNNIYRLLINSSTHTAASITLLHQSTSSTAANQFAVPWQGSYVMSPNGGAAGCLRSAANDRWRVI